MAKANRNVIIILLVMAFCALLSLLTITRGPGLKEITNKIDKFIMTKESRADKIGYEPIDWSRLLHFIPDKTNQNCTYLFNTNSPNHLVNTQLFDNFSAEHRKLLQGVKQFMGREYYYKAPQDTKLTLTYMELAKEPWVKSVCEVGFDVGQSSLAWLMTKPDLVLHSFDLGVRGETGYAVKHLKTMFGDRLKFYFGDSKISLPKMAEKLKGSCDIVSVDGRHDLEFVYSDFINMRRMAASKHIIVGDDIEFPDVKKAWTRLLKLEIVKEAYRCKLPGKDIDFVLGQYKDFSLETY